jgi:type IV pilus assembly protein PilB
MKNRRLGELFVEAGLIDSEQLDHALKVQKPFRHKLGQTLVRLGYITEDILIEYLDMQHGSPGINLHKLYKEVIDESAAHTITRHVAEKYKAIPISFKLEGRTKKLIVAMADPSNLEAIDTIAFITGYSIEPIFTMEEHLEGIIYYHYYKKWQLD